MKKEPKALGGRPQIEEKTPVITAALEEMLSDADQLDHEIPPPALVTPTSGARPLQEVTVEARYAGSI